MRFDVNMQAVESYEKMQPGFIEIDSIQPDRTNSDEIENSQRLMVITTEIENIQHHRISSNKIDDVQHHRESTEIDHNAIAYELNEKVVVAIDDLEYANLELEAPDSASFTSTSSEVPAADELQQNENEDIEWAVICIQTAFRDFLVLNSFTF